MEWGDFGPRICLDAQNEILELKNNLNVVHDYVEGLCREINRIATEVAEGRTPAKIKWVGVVGSWKGAVDSLNAIATSIANQSRLLDEQSTSAEVHKDM